MTTSSGDRLARLARPSGAFAMLALDQRESLRTMLAANRSSVVEDGELTSFKVAAAAALTPHASAVLLDVELGLRSALDAAAIAPGCGVIVAADRLVQEPGGPVTWTEVDEAVLEDDGVAAVANAYKLLVIWRSGEERRRARVVEAFVAGCRARRRAAIVEGIVREADDGPVATDRHVALIVEAATELAALGADLYKAEVPTLGAGDDETIAGGGEQLSAAIDCPWVVLSNGTPPDRFGSAMLAACRGGASGFLAGRAIWTASLAAPDVAGHLRDVAAPRLAALAAAADQAVAARQPRA